MNIPNNFIYYAIAVILTFLISFLLAVKIMLTRENLSTPFRIKGSFVWVLISFYFVVFSVLSILKYNAYNMAMVDLGRMSQAIWNTLHGRFLVSTFEFGNACRMIAHTELIYLLIAPIYLLLPDPKILLVLQTLVISLGALPIYWLAKRRLGGGFIPLCFSLAYLLYPSLQYANLTDFHPDMLATTFLLLAFYYLEEKKWSKYFIFLIISLLCKEYISLILIALGIYIIFVKRTIKVAAVTFFVGIFWFILSYKIIPAFLRGGKENLMVELQYSHLGSNLYQIFINVILQPFSTIIHLMTFEKLATLVLFLLPVGFLSLFGLDTLLIGLPIFIGLVLSSLFSYTNHHNGTIIPFIFISAIGGGYYLVRKLSPRFKNINYAIGVFVLSSSLFSNIFYGPSPLSWRFWDKTSYRYRNNIHNFRVTEHDKIAERFVKMIHADARLSASNHLGAHLSKREIIYHFPYPKDFTNIDYVLVDLLEYAPVYWNPRDDEISALRQLFYNTNFVLRFWQDGILLFEKGPKEKGYYVNVSVIKKASPHYPVNRTFGNRILLLGYDLNYDKFLPGNKYRIIYYWHVLAGFDEPFFYNYFGNVEDLNKEYILIDTFEKDYKKLRIVHLPMYILYPPKEWKAGEIIKEEFEFYIPKDLPAGDYNWKIGVFVVPKFFFIEKENKNLVPGTQEIKLKAIKIGKDN